MTTATPMIGPQSHPVKLSVRPNRANLAIGVVVVWVLAYLALNSTNTLSLDQGSSNALHRWLNHLNDSAAAGRNTSPFFVYFINQIQVGTTHLVTWSQDLLSQPANGRPLPIIGWLGVIAIVTYLSAVFGNWKVALLALVGFYFIGLQGLWQPAMDTLAQVLVAVLIALAIGIPLGIWSGMSTVVHRVITPILDVMQTMPAYVYLLPFALLFLIGPQTGVLLTLVYALPPVVRLTAHGIRSVPSETIEAAQSLGTSRAQVLRTVMLPMALRTIVIGVNQTILAALSMVTIAAFVNAPGLGQVVLTALESQDVGAAFNGGLALVIIGIVLDRVTTAASARADAAARAESKGRLAVAPRRRRLLIAAGLLVTAVLVYESYTLLSAAQFPTAVNLGTHIQSGVTNATDWVSRHLHTVTEALKNAVTYHGLNPLQALLDSSPWFVSFAALVALALVLGGVGAGVTSVICLALVVATGLWQDSMDTLAAVLVGTVLVMVLGIAVGVWMGRSPRADRLIRPVLDAGQVMPAFVYLIPFLALFDVGRFTGIMAAVVYAAPVAIKIVADGIRGVSETTVEAATASGSNTWQIISKVQLPMSIRTLALATNQGLIYVLAMVVVAGLVGGGGLGGDVVTGFSQPAFFGKGLAAGAAIVLLGIMLDRVTQAVARRLDGSAKTVG